MRVPVFLVLSFIISISYGQVDTSYTSATSDVKELLRLSALKSKDESTTVATQVEVPIREVPSIVSVLTEDDIVRSGARDLRELLSLLPGLDFATDVQNVTGMGVRGLWGLEGKVLVLLDGNTMNETSYGAFSFSQHIFLGNIKRIEIIRGPGSAIYGGIGALCVINITSKNYSESTTVGRISQSFGLSQNQLSRQMMQFGFGKRWDNGFSISTTGTISQANISNRLSADTLNYADSSKVNTNQFGFHASYKKLSVAMLYDGHKVDHVEGPGRSVFNGWYAQINYQWRISEKLTLFPTVKIKIQKPWDLENVGGQDGSISSTTNYRNLAGARLLYEPNERFSLAAGMEYYMDDAVYDNLTKSFSNGETSINFNNLALFAQGIHKTKWFNITGGFRVDNHNYFGTAFVPRLGITHAGKYWHVKLLYTNAFKAPTIVNIDVNNNIRPERFASGELEMGFQPREGITITGNFFYTQVKNPILYYSLTGLSSEYRNGEQVGSAGFELSATIKEGWGRLHANYSYYQMANSRESYFDVPDKLALLGFPQHKIAAQAFVILSENISTTFTALLQGSKYYVDTEKNIANIKPIASLNVLFTHTHFLYPSLTLTAGVYNIFDQTQWLVQPYNWASQSAGNKNPTPGMGREFSLSIYIQIKP
jgi:outer membrane receptor for ferrienterochelin and colicin